MNIAAINSLNFRANLKNSLNKGTSSNYKDYSCNPYTSSLECLGSLNCAFVNTNKPIKFNDTNEAEEYFLNKYGIEAEFNNIEQANILKEAVDEVLKLNFKDKKQKLFEGLKVGNKEYPEKTMYACADTKLVFPQPDYQLTNASAVEYIKNLDEKDIGFERLEINFNTNCDIEGFCSKIENQEGKYAFSDLKFALVHELSHWLYAKYSPKDFAVGKIIEPIFNPELEHEKEIISQVSKYAILNINEFIAEYVAGRLSGVEYSKEVDELYDKYNGMQMF